MKLNENHILLFLHNLIIKSFILSISLLFSISCSEKGYTESIESKTSNKIIYFETEKVERFEVLVDTSNPNVDGSTQLFESDKGLIILPKGYSPNGEPTKLIIYCHSGGGTVTDKYSEAENDNYCKYFVSLGYAVMDMAGMPTTFSNRLKIDYGRCVGSFIAVRSYFEGYNFAVNNYNLDTAGCFMFSNSNGGLVSLNLGNLTSMPIIAQAGICPLLSIEQNAWYILSAAMTGGEFSAYQNRANIIRIYRMQDIKTQSELDNAKYDKEKVGDYDPYDFVLNKTQKAYKIPYKVFSRKMILMYIINSQKN